MEVLFFLPNCLLIFPEGFIPPPIFWRVRRRKEALAGWQRNRAETGERESGLMGVEAQVPQSAGSVPPFSPHITNKGSIFSDDAACVRSERSGNVLGDPLCVTDVNPKPYRSCYICFGFVRSTEGRGVCSMVKGQTTCHISLPSLATTEGCIQRKGWH